MARGRGQRASGSRNLLFSFLGGPSFLILGLSFPPRLPSGDLVGVVELKQIPGPLSEPVAEVNVVDYIIEITLNHFIHRIAFVGVTRGSHTAFAVEEERLVYNQSQKVRFVFARIGEQRAEEVRDFFSRRRVVQTNASQRSYQSGANERGIPLI